MLGMLGYILTHHTGEKFTEFYILGISDKAEDYPQELKAGEEGRVIVGIANQEYEPVTYRVEVVIDGVINNEVKPVMLKHGEKWEEPVTFTPQRAGDNQKVEFLLYRQGQNEVYQTLYLWVDVR
jgi:uncharacterized membrane protein